MGNQQQCPELQLIQQCWLNNKRKIMKKLLRFYHKNELRKVLYKLKQ